MWAGGLPAAAVLAGIMRHPIGIPLGLGIGGAAGHAVGTGIDLTQDKPVKFSDKAMALATTGGALTGLAAGGYNDYKLQKQMFPRTKITPKALGKIGLKNALLGMAAGGIAGTLSKLVLDTAGDLSNK